MLRNYYAHKWIHHLHFHLLTYLTHTCGIGDQRVRRSFVLLLDNFSLV